MKRTGLKVLRVKKGLSQAQMAECLGICLSYYSLIECGKATGSFKFWKRLRSVFGLTAQEAFELRENENF